MSNSEGKLATECLDIRFDHLYINGFITGNTPEDCTLFNRDKIYICRSNIYLLVLYNNAINYK